MKNLTLVLFASLMMLSCENTEVLPKQAGQFEVHLGKYVAENFVIDGEVYTSADDYCTNYDDSGYLDIYDFELYSGFEYEIEFIREFICTSYGMSEGYINIIEGNMIEFIRLDNENNFDDKRTAYIIQDNEETTTLRWDENTSDAIEIIYRKE